jgi:hypothetical protein
VEQVREVILIRLCESYTQNEIKIVLHNIIMITVVFLLFQGDRLATYFEHIENQQKFRICWHTLPTKFQFIWLGSFRGEDF